MTDLYVLGPSSRYWFVGGFNLAAAASVVLGILPCVPGFAMALSDKPASSGWGHVYGLSWFVAVGCTAAVYLALSLGWRRVRPVPEGELQPLNATHSLDDDDEQQ